MPSREAVNNAIDSELIYQQQQTLDPSRPDMIADLSPGDSLLCMEHCLAEARRAWYHGAAPHEDAAEFVRKVTALGLRFMAANSAPMRKLS